MEFIGKKNIHEQDAYSLTPRSHVLLCITIHLYFSNKSIIFTIHLAIPPARATWDNENNDV
jgi:hypothetical protein